MELTILGCQKFMSFIGNIAAAQSAKAIGKYNESVTNQQANLQRQKTETARKVYNNIDRPRFVKAQEQAYDFLYTKTLKTGFEIREGTTPYLVLIEQKVNQATDLAIEDYNSTTAYYDGLNQESLLRSKAVGEAYKGQMMARTEMFKAAGSMFGNYSKSGGKSILAS